MAKFLVLYNSSESASDRMAQATPEEMKAGMDSWIAWSEEAKKVSKFEFGMPLQAASRVTADGGGVSDSQVSGYSIMEGNKDAIIESLKNHPHLKTPGSSIDLLEMLSMPGMGEA